MDILSDIENAIKKFKGLTNDKKAKEITGILNEIRNKKDGVFKNHFKNENIIIRIEKVIDKGTGKRGNARADIVRC